MTPKLADLQPGDILLYYGNDLFSKIIALKTWHRVSHVETYIGDGKSIASRNGIGVGTYPIRWDGLIAVRRPRWSFNLDAVLRWQKNVEGWGYDWSGLLAFIGIKDKPDHQMFCSDHATRAAFRSGGVPFDDGESTEFIAPFEFLVTPAYRTVWAK